MGHNALSTILMWVWIALTIALLTYCQREQIKKETRQEITAESHRKIETIHTERLEKKEEFLDIIEERDEAFTRIPLSKKEKRRKIYKSWESL